MQEPQRPAPAMRIAVLAPFGLDAEVAGKVLREWGFEVFRCRNVEEVCDCIRREAGAVMITEEALTPEACDTLLVALRRQPAWSDVPIIVLTDEGALAREFSRSLQLLSEDANLTLMNRPVRLAGLVTALRSSLRARQRQLQVRNFIEERVVREAELQQARLQAEEANDAKSRFLATMSHELRTPLNAIAGYTEILSLGVHGPVTAEQLVALERIGKSQRYLLSLINDILNFAKVESGHVSFNVREVCLEPLLRRIETFVQPQLTAKGISYHWTPETCQLDILVDEDKAQQILLNLLSNAIKFTPAGGRISIDAKQQGAKVTISVRDTGVGIPEDKANDVFEPFVQLGRNFSSDSQGTGLGLSISRDLARKMDGELTVQSEVGKGSTFTLELPAAPSRSAARPAEQPLGDQRRQRKKAKQPRNDGPSEPVRGDVGERRVAEGVMDPGERRRASSR
jgi:signal transduction histidine kinase